jgi:hypothetical protein
MHVVKYDEREHSAIRIAMTELCAGTEFTGTTAFLSSLCKSENVSHQRWCTVSEPPQHTFEVMPMDINVSPQSLDHTLRHPSENMHAAVLLQCVM